MYIHVDLITLLVSYTVMAVVCGVSCVCGLLQDREVSVWSALLAGLLTCFLWPVVAAVCIQEATSK